MLWLVLAFPDLCSDASSLVCVCVALKETVDLSVVEVRKGISHMARSLESSGMAA